MASVSAAPGDGQPTGVQAATDERSVHDLEQRLDEELDAFDALIAKEQMEIRARENEAPGGERVETSVSVEVLPARPERDSPALPAALRTPDWAAQTAQQGEAPEDDDIVARQLREAAERETDPALRERLWDEYRRYKGQTP